MKPKRYCPMCELWLPANHYECKACGMPTEKAAHEPIAKPTPRVVEKAAKRKAIEQQRRAAYRLVDDRDGHGCRFCGRLCQPTLEAVPERLEHHHILPRSLGGKHDTENLITLCLSCHCDVTAHRLNITGSADKQVTFEGFGSIWHG